MLEKILGMHNGEKVKLNCKPSEVINRFTQDDGKIRDEFIEFGVLYINPKHVSMLCYEEEDINHPGVFRMQGVQRK